MIISKNWEIILWLKTYAFKSLGSTKKVLPIAIDLYNILFFAPNITGRPTHQISSRRLCIMYIFNHTLFMIWLLMARVQLIFLSYSINGAAVK